jgi:hypothetical protein
MSEPTGQAIAPGASSASESAAPPLIRTQQPALTGSEGRLGFPAIHAPSRAAVVLLIAGTIVAVLGFMAGEVLAMFAIGLIIVYLIDPVVTMLARRGCRERSGRSS